MIILKNKIKTLFDYLFYSFDIVINLKHINK